MTTTKKFRDLTYAETFDFIDPDHPSRNSYFERCMKTGPRTYSPIEGFIVNHRVGSINARVFNVRSIRKEA